MPRLVTKFKYLKPNARQRVGGYANYIATREGVDKIDESFQLAPASKKQEQLIKKILRDFPDAKEMLEYEDYQREPTMGNAWEFITRALEDNAPAAMQAKTYAPTTSPPGPGHSGSAPTACSPMMGFKCSSVKCPTS